MKLTYIYGLRDPETKLIRYVGKSDKPRRRLSRHLCRTKRGLPSHNYNWIRSLLKRDLRPELVFLMQIPHSNWKQIERLIIASLKEDGHDITNTAEGGFGGPFMKGQERSKETRKKISEGHKKLWNDERRRKWRSMAKAQWENPEIRAKHEAAESSQITKLRKIESQRKRRAREKALKLNAKTIPI